MMKKWLSFKKSAIHNLIVTHCKREFHDGEINEGLVIPEDILEKSDIFPWEQVVVTKIKGDNWINRIKTFVIPGKAKGKVEARGSLASFLNKEDLICVIALTIFDEERLKFFNKNKLPLFDLGFDPLINKDNLIKSELNIEYKNKKRKNVEEYKQFKQLKKTRKNLPKLFLQSLILNLKVNKSHPNCLQGSAEIPTLLMRKAGVKKYQSVSVYNVTRGGVADTYLVPTPPKIVMTTGAMANFAKIGEEVNIASYIISVKKVKPKIILSNGFSFFGEIEL